MSLDGVSKPSASYKPIPDAIKMNSGPFKLPPEDSTEHPDTSRAVMPLPGPFIVTPDDTAEHPDAPKAEGLAQRSYAQPKCDTEQKKWEDLFGPKPISAKFQDLLEHKEELARERAKLPIEKKEDRTVAIPDPDIPVISPFLDFMGIGTVSIGPFGWNVNDRTLQFLWFKMQLSPKTKTMEPDPILAYRWAHLEALPDLAKAIGMTAEEMKGYNRLNLSCYPITDLNPLKECPLLTALTLGETGDLSPLKECKNLALLELDHAVSIDLHPVKWIMSLKSLIINDTPLKDKDAEPLKECANLRYLGLKGTELSEKKVQELRLALPDCKIVWSSQP